MEKFFYYKNKLNVVEKLSSEYSDAFGLCIYDLTFYEYKETPFRKYQLTRMARHRNEFLLTYEQAKDQYPEFFI
jgi:hypothetical protein